MYCMKCDKHLMNCDCPDLKERLESLSNCPNLALSKCKTCGEFLPQCDCDKPERALYVQGEEMNMPREGGR